MSARKILLADRDSTVRQHLADTFTTAGYDVETTDSTGQVLCAVLEKEIPVVLLGNGCDKNIAMGNLISLLKGCNRGVTIILVSDEESLPTIRSIRQEGIFYHALKPTCREDTAEILAAVACAFNKSESSDGKKAAEFRETVPVNEAPCVAVPIPNQASEDSPESGVYDAVPSTPNLRGESGYAKDRIQARAAVISTALAAGAGWIYFLYSAAVGVNHTSDFMMWCFLGFVALLIVGQFLPAFYSARAARKVVAQQLRESVTEPQHAGGQKDEQSSTKNPLA